MSCSCPEEIMNMKQKRFLFVAWPAFVLLWTPPSLIMYGPLAGLVALISTTIGFGLALATIWLFLMDRPQVASPPGS
jgi:hypothetical protein